MKLCRSFISVDPNAQSILMGFTHPFSKKVARVFYQLFDSKKAISCGQCRSSKMIYYAEMHRYTVEKLTGLKSTYHSETQAYDLCSLLFNIIPYLSDIFFKTVQQ